MLVPRPLGACARTEATSGRGDCLDEVCDGFGVSLAFGLDVEFEIGSADDFEAVFGLTGSDTEGASALAEATVAEASFAAACGLPASALLAADFFTSLGSRSIVVGFGVS